MNKNFIKTVCTIAFLFVFVLNLSAQIPPGFTSLFNGKNLNGWEVKAKPADITKNFWKVENNVIVVNSIGEKTHDYIWLMTQKEYKDFELLLKFAAFKTSTGNSGIQLRSRYDEKEFWLNGPQIDIHPPLPWRTGFMWDETRGVQRWIFPNIPKEEWVNEEMRKEKILMYFYDETETWNELKISAKGNKIKAWLNGVLITNFNEKEILNSEIHKKYKVGNTGKICLQLHTGDELLMKFKDIYVKEL